MKSYFQNNIIHGYPTTLPLCSPHAQHAPPGGVPSQELLVDSSSVVLGDIIVQPQADVNANFLNQMIVLVCFENRCNNKEAAPIP